MRCPWRRGRRAPAWPRRPRAADLPNGPPVQRQRLAVDAELLREGMGVERAGRRKQQRLARRVEDGGRIDRRRRHPGLHLVVGVEAFEVDLSVGVDLPGCLGERVPHLLRRQDVDGGRIIEAALQRAGGRWEGERRSALRIERVARPDRGRHIGGDRPARRLVEAQVGQVGGLAERACGGGQTVEVVIAGGPEHVELVRREVAPAQGARIALNRGAAGAGCRGTVVGRCFDALKRALHDEVDHAGDRVAAVDRRGAVGQDFDAVDCG